MSTLSAEWAAFSESRSPEGRAALAGKIEAMLDGLQNPDERDYRAGCPALNASVLKGDTLAERWVRLIEPDTATGASAALTLGTLVHMAALEPEKLRNWAEHLTLGPVNPKTGETYGAGTKAYAKFAADNAGKLVVDAEMVETAKGCLSAIEAHPEAHGLLRTPGQKEQALVRWHESGVWIKGKPDFIGGNFVLDVKTTREHLTARAFRGECFAYGYHIQAATYLFLAPRPVFYFLAVTKSEPYAARLFLMRNNYAAGDPMAESDMLHGGRLAFERRVSETAAALAMTAQALRDGCAMNWQQVRALWPAYETDVEDFPGGVPLIV